MSKIDTVKKILATANGTRVGGRELLPGKKTEFISEEVKKELRGQWDGAGRDAAKIILKLTESNGTDLYLTGWDGYGNFVGYESDKGFGYIPSDRLEAATIDKEWDSEITLSHVRQNLDEMDRHQVKELVHKFHKAVTKRAQPRRFSEAKNFFKRVGSNSQVWNSDAMTAKAKKPYPKLGKSEPKGKKNGLYTTDGNYGAPKTESFSSSLSRFRSINEAVAPELAKINEKKPAPEAPALTRSPIKLVRRAQ